MKKTLISPANHPAPRGTYSPGLLVEHDGARTLYLTGQLAVDIDGNVVAPLDATAQTEFVFSLIGQILEAGGMGFGDVVKVQTYLTHMPDFPKFSAVRNRFFADSRPVSTLLEVKGLAREGCCVEIEVVAMKCPAVADAMKGTTSPIYWIDAFTDHAFGGNTAAIVPLDAWPGADLLQRIASQNGVAATGFFVRTGPARAQLRWFTPGTELDLCGHATFASAHVLFNELGQAQSPIMFDTKSGPLTASRRGSLIELDFPARPAGPAEAPEALLRGLAKAPERVLRSERMWLCIYATAADVLGISPDFALLASLAPGRFIVTAPGTDCDFVSRFFAPDVGLKEDSVTGSAHCTLAPYWAERLGKKSLHARQVSQRGGELWCELDGDRVRIAGQGVQYLKGSIAY